MLPFNPAHYDELQWRQPSAFARVYELRSGDSTLAKLEFQKALGTLAIASTAAGSWTFKRSGFVAPKVSARIADTETEVALFESSITAGGGHLRLPGGEVLELRATNFWRTSWMLSTGDREPLFHMHNKGMVHHASEIELEAAAKSRPDLGLLLTLSWYILVLQMQDAAGAVVAST
jgi:hypothetical protein